MSHTSPGGRRSLRRLAAWLVLAFVPAVVGAPFPAPAWYRSLRKPAWAPSPSVFGPVWTALYTTIGIAPWLADRSGPLPLGATAAYGIQLALNAAWTPIFFGLRRPFVALVTIVAMWLAVLATVVAFWRQRRLAGAILLPYLAWITFATALNAAIWRLNR